MKKINTLEEFMEQVQNENILAELNNSNKIKDGYYEVLDDKQQISTLLEFFKSGFTVRHLQKNGVILKLFGYLDNRRYIEDVVNLGNICL